MTGFYKIWARRDSNPRPKDYESSALPLRHRPLLKYGVLIFSCCALPVSCGSDATYCGENSTFLVMSQAFIKLGVFILNLSSKYKKIKSLLYKNAFTFVKALQTIINRS